MRGRDGGREWLRNLSPDPVVRAEFLQRLRVDATRFVLHPNLSDEEQGENLQVIKDCEMLLPALAQELSELGKPLNPPNAVLHYGREPWEKRLTLDRLLKLEQKYPSLIKKYAEGCLPFHRIGEPLWLEHIETGEYSCLKRALGFLLDDSEQKLAEAHSNAVRIAQKGQDSPQGKGKRNRGPEYGKDAEGIRIAQAAAAPKRTRRMPSVAQKDDKDGQRLPSADQQEHPAGESKGKNLENGGRAEREAGAEKTRPGNDRKGDPALLDGKDRVSFRTAEQYLGITERQRQKLCKSGSLTVEGQGSNRKITTESLKTYLPPENPN